jgi:hypothetical protein
MAEALLDPEPLIEEVLAPAIGRPKSTEQPYGRRTGRPRRYD